MKAGEILRAIMRERSIRPTDLAAILGVKNNVLSERLSQKNISIDKMNEMLAALGYKLAVLPAETKIPEKGYEIGSEDP